MVYGTQFELVELLKRFATKCDSWHKFINDTIVS